MSSSLGSLKYYDIALTNLTNPDKEGIRAFEITGSSAFTAYYPAYTKMLDATAGNQVSPSDGAASHIRFIVDEGTDPTPSASVRFHKQPTDTTRGDFEATGQDNNPETDVDIPEIDIAMRSIAIVAKTRKLKACLLYTSPSPRDP